MILFLHLLFLGSLLWFFQPSGTLRWYYFTGALFRIACSLTLGWIYLIHSQSGDTLMYHQAATQLHHLGLTSFHEYLSYLFTAHYGLGYGEARTEFFIKILSLFYFFTGGNYWITALYFAFISFFSAWHLVKVLYQQNGQWLIPAVMAFLFLPSSTLWTSGILKDTLTNSALLYLAAACFTYRYSLRLSFAALLPMLLALLLIFFLKFYLAAVLAFCMGLLALSIALSKITLRLWLRVCILTLGTGLFALLVTHFNVNLHLRNLPQVLYDNYLTMQLLSDEHECLVFRNLEPNYLSLLQHFPESLVSGLFRPFFWEAKPLLFPFALENLALFMATVLSLIYLPKVHLNSIFWITLLFIVILAALLPLVAPNFGTLMRYRAAYLPFFTFLILQIPYRRIFLKK